MHIKRGASATSFNMRVNRVAAIFTNDSPDLVSIQTRRKNVERLRRIANAELTDLPHIRENGLVVSSVLDNHQCLCVAVYDVNIAAWVPNVNLFIQKKCLTNQAFSITFC